MTIRIDQSALPDDLNSHPAVKAFFDSLIEHETMGGSDTNALVTSIARALDNIDSRLVALEADENEDDGDWQFSKIEG